MYESVDGFSSLFSVLVSKFKKRGGDIVALIGGELMISSFLGYLSLGLLMFRV